MNSRFHWIEGFGGVSTLKRRWRCCLYNGWMLLIWGLGCAEPPFLKAAETVGFQRQVLPILSDKCFQCHGPDAAHRKADLRLDIAGPWLGQGIVVPGNPEESVLYRRLVHEDDEERMPPDSSGKALSAAEIQTLYQWIQQGAPWEKHWAFIPPRAVSVPITGTPYHPIDAFVLEKLQEKGRGFSPETDRRTWIRRVSFDLTGLPPTEEETDRFLADPFPEAHARVVDRLLRSPAYGERMAMWWMDLARYADTDGFQADLTRTQWPWRDWVIQSFNGNMPFDQFTRMQFAGDLMEPQTAENILATAFHRNHMTNGEGGRDPEESRIDYVIDRVNTMGTVWLGLTLGCAQCHSHKFDPISHQDYYRFAAYFDSIDENGRSGRKAIPFQTFQSPYLDGAIAEATRLVTRLEEKTGRIKQRTETSFKEWLYQERQRLDQGLPLWIPLTGEVTSQEGTSVQAEDDGIFQTYGPNPKQDDYWLYGNPMPGRMSGLRLEVFPHPTHTKEGLSRGESGEFILTNVKVHRLAKGSRQLEEIPLQRAVADFQADTSANNRYGNIQDTLDDDPRNGWTTIGSSPKESHQALFTFRQPVMVEDGDRILFVMKHRSTLGDANIGRFRVSVTRRRGEFLTRVKESTWEKWLAVPAGKVEDLPSEWKESLWEEFLLDQEEYVHSLQSLIQAREELKDLESQQYGVEVMILKNREERRKTHVLVRGVWDKKGEEVTTGLPDSILPWLEESSRDRLGLAEWLVSERNPLTARVMVNHLWRLCFGMGLVRTPQDFGLQGEAPTHPELLDWLAVEFVRSGWDVKAMIRSMVLSQTYRQQSLQTSELSAWDPDNRYLARMNRFRLESWMLRDAALRYSGLLNATLGGPPAKPYQPAGLWEENFMGRFTYRPSLGAAQYRRTLYAFWRRSVAPSFLFDTAQRRVCEVAPSRTNTPLQALTLLNDDTYLETSYELSRMAIQEDQPSMEGWKALYRRVLNRDPDFYEVRVLEREWRRALAYYHENPSEASRLIRAARKREVFDENDVSVAAGVVVARMILNLDETMTHE